MNSRFYLIVYIKAVVKIAGILIIDRIYRFIQNVMEWLNCSKSKVTNIMNVLRSAGIIEKVTCLGVGKYKFR